MQLTTQQIWAYLFSPSVAFSKQLSTMWFSYSPSAGCFWFWFLLGSLWETQTATLVNNCSCLVKMLKLHTGKGGTVFPLGSQSAAISPVALMLKLRAEFNWFHFGVVKTQPFADAARIEATTYSTVGQRAQSSTRHSGCMTTDFFF